MHETEGNRDATRDVTGRIERLSPAKRALLERRLRQRRTLAETGIPRRADPSACPLSFSQERFWFLEELEPGGFAFNRPTNFVVTGPLDVLALERTLEEMLRRHTALNVSIATRDGRPEQTMLPDARVSLPVTDLSGLGDGETDKEVRRHAVEEARAPLDLANGPLLRVRLLRLGTERHALLMTIHHIAFDGWSASVFSREMAACYEAFHAGRPSGLPDLPIQFADFAAWQRDRLRGDTLERLLAYWRGRLAGAPPVAELPADRARPGRQTSVGATHKATLPRDLSAAIRELSRREGVTVFMTLLAALKVLLHRYTGAEDVAVGTPVAGRTRVEIEGLVGFFVNNLVLRTSLAGRPTFRELLGRVRETAVGAYEHQELPFEQLVQELHPTRDLSRTPLFQVLLQLRNLPGTTAWSEGVTFEELDVDCGIARLDLSIDVVEHDGGFVCAFEYNTGLFDAATIERTAEQYCVLLREAVADPDARIDDCSLVTARARDVLPDPTQPLSATWEGAVHTLFREQAARAPRQLAVADALDRWEYGELEARSNQLAHALQAAGIAKGDVVAIYAHRSASVVWAVLAVLEAGAAFLMLDPAYPAPQQVDRLTLARPRGWLQIGAAGAPPGPIEEFLAGAELRCRFVLPGKAQATELFAEYPTTGPEIDIGPDDLAYVAFTSGSTGAPKGILGRHGPLTHFQPWLRQTFELGAADRFSMVSGLAHDPLHRDLFTPLLLGATICVPDPQEIAPGRLARWMARERVTIANLTPAMGRVLTGESGDTRTHVGSLRCVFFVGDMLTRRDVARLRRLAPRVRCVNYYGTTETQRALGYYEVPEAGEREVLPVGQGIRDVQLLVLNGAGRLAGVGERGEICVRSPHLALGYLDARLTRGRFVGNPFTGRPDDRMYRTGDVGRYLPDGGVEVLGRVDTQVKIRGFRVETAEVEGALAQHPTVREVAVVADKDGAGETRLVAYAVFDGPDESSSATALRAFLGARLPAYMIPSAFIPLEALPLTPNGKLDCRALPRPDEAHRPPGARFVAPRTDVERELVAIWEAVIGRKGVGVTDDFFDLGGHSLLALRLFDRVEKAFGRKLPLASLFQAPTIECLARLIGLADADAEWSSLVAIRPEGSKPPIFFVHGVGGDVLIFRDLAELLGPEQPVYGLRAQGLDGRRKRHERVEEMAEAYVREIQALRPKGPYFLAGQSFGGLVVYEMAQRLVAAGQDVRMLALLDTYGPGYRTFPSSLHRVESHLKHIWSLAPTKKVEYVKIRIRAARMLLIRRLWRIADRTLRALGQSMPRAVENAEGAHYLRALRMYEVRPYPGTITLFRAEEQPVGLRPDPYLGWEPFAGSGVDVYGVPGSHERHLFRPHVVKVAEAMRTALDRVRGDGSCSDA